MVRVLVGVLLFVSSSFGASLGCRVLPSDTHHVVGQWGGVLLALFPLRRVAR